MTDFMLFRWKPTGVVESLPADYATHPVFGENLEPYDNSDGEYEEDKVVLGHEVPVEQRTQTIANPAEGDENTTTNEGND